MFTHFAQRPSHADNKSKGKIKMGTVIPAVILIGCVVGAFYFSGFFDGILSQTDVDTSGILTPTRNLVGTWKTPLPVEFNLATDYEDFVNLKDVGTENRTMTWTISATDNENIVLVNVEFAASDRQIATGSGYVPDVSPMQLTGTINGTQLTLTRGNQGPIDQIGSVGVFTFTTSQMEGTWHDHWEGGWEQNVYTATNSLKLMKQ